MKNRRFLAFICSALFIFFSSCSTNKIPEGTFTLCTEADWENITSGIDIIENKIGGMNVRWACVRVDLNTEGLEIRATPNFAGEKSSKLNQTDFGLKNKPVVSINTTPFSYGPDFDIPTGIVKFDGKELYPPVLKYSALCITASPPAPRAFILQTQSPSALLNYPYAFGGFFTILKDGQIIPYEKTRRSRTACGTSQDHRFLYLFAACAQNDPSGNNGLTYEECALILQQLGCTDAMQFDGGHSTGLTVNGHNKIKPALQRKIPAALAFYIN